ncbi:unnamed protein product [Enterobius vermicularis]|uniref:ANK_REP_REGION domain-containing protein n=1 Tax=Enterobius vermicularis TaxID=51028 RepID=A0A0N4V6V5_ENTVE|nr:unnamed protein product [Enterobius vermicularis]
MSKKPSKTRTTAQEEIDQTRLDAKSFEAVRNLHLNWYNYALKALIGQMGKQLYEHLRPDERRKLAKCLYKVDEKSSLIEGAKCLIRIRKKAKATRQNNGCGNLETDHLFCDDSKLSFITTKLPKNATVATDSNTVNTLNLPKKQATATLDTKNFTVIKLDDISQEFFNRHKMELNVLAQRDNPMYVASDSKIPNSTLRLDSDKRMSNRLTLLAKRQKRQIKKLRKFQKVSDEETFLKYLSRATKRIVRQLVIKMKLLDKIPDPFQKSAIQKIAKLIRVSVHGENVEENAEKWLNSYQKLLEFRKKFEEKKALPGAKVYQKRLYDIVLEDHLDDKKKFSQHTAPDFITLALSLMNTLKLNNTDDEFSSIKFLSPRFASVMPDKVNAKSTILSPSVLSFYEDDNPNNIASLPKILDKAGMEKHDRDTVVEVMMDVSGAKNTVNMALELMKTINATEITQQTIEATSKLDDAFKNLEASFDAHQKSEINSNGFTFLEPDQLETIMQKYGVDQPEKVGFDIDSYRNQSKGERHSNLWKTLELIAYNNTHRRMKRDDPGVLVALTVLRPIILSPYLFAPVFGLSILGPVILSPNLFSPLILNPSVLGPFILSPSMFTPFILSPFVFSPYILSPVFAGPFILTPYCLSPNIMNPYVFSPLILSPYVLSPDILSPQALGGPVLSPNAFSPAVLTNAALMTSVLSPSFMS